MTIKTDSFLAAKIAFDHVIKVALDNELKPARAAKEMTDVRTALQSAFRKMGEVKNE